MCFRNEIRLQIGRNWGFSSHSYVELLSPLKMFGEINFADEYSHSAARNLSFGTVSHGRMWGEIRCRSSNFLSPVTKRAGVVLHFPNVQYKAGQRGKQGLKMREIVIVTGEDITQGPFPPPSIFANTTEWVQVRRSGNRLDCTVQ
jgi:hypothetical protein